MLLFGVFPCANMAPYRPPFCLGPPPPLLLPYEDSLIALCTQFCMMRPCGEEELSIADGPYAAIMALEATDQHLLRTLLPSLMVKIASMRFDEEITEESQGWLDMRDADSKDKADGNKEKPSLTPKMISKVVERVLAENDDSGEGEGVEADSRAREAKYGPVLRSIAPQMYDAINEK